MPVILGLISLNVALLWGRFRIHIDNTTKELDDKITQHLELFAPSKALTNLMEMAIIKNPTDENELVQEFGKACDKLKHIIEFVYHVDTAHRMYQHDQEKINNLNSGEYYRATHSFSQMTNVWELGEKAIFSAYMDAQYKAKGRGVEVVRLYIVDNEVDLFQSDEIVQHFQTMIDQKIDAKVITRNRLTEGYEEDFIIISNTILGIGKTRDGKIFGAEYSFNNPSSKSDRFDEYLKYFSVLEGSAKSYRELNKPSNFSQ